MNQLQKVFNYQEQQVRTVLKDNQPWFVAKDVCDILELTNVTRSVDRLNPKQKGLHTVNTLGGMQQMAVINEAGVYKLVFTSRKPEAEKFTDWIVEEVLPSIRQTGSYSTDKIVPLNEKQSLVALMKLSAITAEETEELKLVTTEHSNKIQELEIKVEQQITLDHGEQRRLQKGVARRVYEFTEDKKEAARLFKEIYREIKDRFGVASYKDVKRQELQSAIRYIENWLPRKVS